jgi:hypothetical protein
VVVSQALGIRPGAYGLVAGGAAARAAAAYCARDDVGAEPGLWLPWQIVEYPLE